MFYHSQGDEQVSDRALEIVAEEVDTRVLVMEACKSEDHRELLKLSEEQDYQDHVVQVILVAHSDHQEVEVARSGRPGGFEAREA